MNRPETAKDETGLELTFPFRLHSMLEEAERTGNESILSWHPNGKEFRVLKAHFEPEKYKTMLRQFKLYGFECRERGPFTGPL